MSVSRRNFLGGAVASVAAAVSVRLGKTPRETPVGEIQKFLRAQGAHLG